MRIIYEACHQPRICKRRYSGGSSLEFFERKEDWFSVPKKMEVQGVSLHAKRHTWDCLNPYDWMVSLFVGEKCYLQAPAFLVIPEFSGQPMYSLMVDEQEYQVYENEYVFTGRQVPLHIPSKQAFKVLFHGEKPPAVFHRQAFDLWCVLHGDLWRSVI